jgi:hypothetical protein
MKKFFRRSFFVIIFGLMLIGMGQPRGRAALDKPTFDQACMTTCQQLNLECFLNAVTKSEQHKCTAEYRQCIAHCK